MDHRRHVERDQALVERVPERIGQRRRGPVAAGGVGVQVAADEPHLADAALELGDRAVERGAARLRQLADGREVVGVKIADATDQLVAGARPVEAGLGAADVIGPSPRHAGENSVRSAPRSALQAKLVVLDRFADLIVADAAVDGRGKRGVGEPVDLILAVALVRLGRRRVVAVAVDDHDGDAPRRRDDFSYRCAGTWTSPSNSFLAVRSSEARTRRRDAPSPLGLESDL